MKEPKGISCSRDEELHACRQWVKSLTKDELLRAIEFAFVDNDDSGGTTTSHEYDILKEMLQLQSPPPTPIHPKALYFRPASQHGVTDGRDETLRIHQNRFRRPRLFQLTERGSVGCGSLRSFQRGRRQQQPQVPTRSASRRFDVFARRFVTPWGQVLSVGCTTEQKEADDILLQATVVYHNGPCNVDGRNDSSPSYCCFSESNVDASRYQAAGGILRILKVASRGRFLSHGAPPAERKNRTATASSTWFAPWFDPTQQWFSLPMYLASRYEVALWNAFRNRESVPLTGHFPVDDAVDKLDRDRLQLLVQRAALRSLVSDIIPRDVSECRIRDCLLWKLFTSSSLKTYGSMLSVWVSPLVELDTPVDQTRQFLRKHVQEIAAHEMERTLLEGVERDDALAEAEGHQRKRKKKNKKKIRRPTARESHDDLLSCPSDEHEELEIYSEQAIEEPSLRYPSNGTSERQRTRNIITCLTILEETIEYVFEKVGLPQTEPFEVVERSRNGDAVQFPPNVRHGDRVNPKEEAPRNQQNETLPSHQSEPVSDDSLEVKNDHHQPMVEAMRQQQSQSSSDAATVVGDDSVSGQLDEVNIVTEEDVVPLLVPKIQSQDIAADSQFETKVELEASLHRSPPIDFSWGLFDEITYGHSATRFQSRDRSILEELFLDQERHDSKNGEELPASSTAASIASSSNKECEAVDIDEVELVDKCDLDDNSSVLEIIEVPLNGNVMEDIETPINSTVMVDIEVVELLPNVDLMEKQLPQGQLIAQEDALVAVDETHKSVSRSRSPSPQAPATPSPRLSPLLFSLADLRELRRSAISEHNRTPNGQQITSLTAGSLPSSPIPPTSNRLTLSWSREDLRKSSCRDDLQITGKKRVGARDSASTTYAKIASKAMAKPLASNRRMDPNGMQIAQKQGNLDPRANGLRVPQLKREIPDECCARSETYVEGQEEEHNWNEAPRTSTSEEVEVNTITRDGSTTITSALSQREEETTALREERNSYRDLCLTLGSEVAKLRNLLAAHKGTSMHIPMDFTQTYPNQIYHAGFDPDSVRPFFQNASNGQTLGTMSDAGLHRGDGSQVSEDDHHDSMGCFKIPSSKRSSSNVTAPGSDTSVEPNASSLTSPETLPLNRDSHETVVSHGLHSRLTKDVINFLNAVTVQLRKQDAKRRSAFERMTRLVTTLWPRAQVKLYGSHVTGLCLPSSDLDFVICLPAVHKNALAVAPGVLEGRNAINETSQKILARKLKGESWIDPRSIKTIERTVVPVIKVSTKDTRARVLQLDVSFDSPEHHGLEAVEMIRSIMDELPMIRPLVLVLKQFLLDRGLLTAYTGGLSSYCLFLMVARYLQEQPPSWGDCGSLLMGFLDFYGNSFDPRALGISVRRRKYFARPNYVVSRNLVPVQPLWNANHLQAVNTNPSAVGHPDMSRRNSFSDRGNVDAGRGTTPASLSRPPRFQPNPAQRFVPHYHTDQSAGVPFDHGRPYTFDPLFVEDPLSPGNNVGRNAFRIFQVQRAFSDAHRALVASLEWDLHSTGELNDAADYPLLKCLLQSEDVFYEL